ncbi:hypothetical protein KOR34_37820 [Posidoniimonas corsicana]|uniref:Glycosyl hydrolases family 2, sugar binding domain n=1 Tax=Posidoniimonas corsicana TaxID=1938618 RepID=A0A5C5V5Y7_9BACT|nr:glycosyl hydrolase [Posidoniimonas corsicana]TWT33946.1 hypothetical protein KOR34_37820 [Posidoniimonas corsicana]
MSNTRTPTALAVLLSAALLSPCAGDGLSQLRDDFRNPPEAAWPRTWWHWTKGAVRKEGITKDLEWMKGAGIAGFQLADVNAGGGQNVEPTVDYGSAEWLDAVGHAADEAERLGLEMAVFSSPGWSMTGGPWVRPEQAMKKLVWSVAQVTADSPAPIALPQPPRSEGEFLDLGAGRGGQTGFYRDARVLAYRTPDAELGPLTPAAVETNNGPIDGQRLFDGSYSASTDVRAPADGGAAWIEQSFDKPVTVRSITLAGRGGIPCGRVTASDDGRRYRALVTLPGTQLYRQARVRTFAIPATTAKYFRIELTGAPIRPAETMSEAPPQPAESYSLVEWRLNPGARVHRWEEKAGFRHLFEYETVADQAEAAAAAIPRDGVLDLTDRLGTNGALDWTPPAGEWTVLRLGYSLTGARNRPATPAGSGYEVDKLSRKHTNDYYDQYAKLLRQAVGGNYGRGLGYWLVDSWEAGTQNWTEEMVAEFSRRRGYDPTPYLPVLTGRVVGDAQTSNRFLWDFRRTLADMYADNHYGVLHDRLAADGLGLYSEASGVSLEIPEDTLLNKSRVDIPMGEFWVRDLHPRLMYLQDVRGAASAAHAYGKPIVAAEAFTGGGYESPFSLKRVSDYWLAQGINRLIYHTSAHQPLDTPPGNTMVGTHLHRNITWAEHARPLNEYFARLCCLLQQGQPAVDIAYLLGEGAPSTPPIWGAGTQPAPPDGYKHDFLNADVLLNRLSVGEDGRLTLPDGMSYRVLVLPNEQRMRPELMEKLWKLVIAGAVIVGPRPISSPSLMGQPDTDNAVAQLGEELWGDLNGVTRTIRHVGEGMVVWGRPLADVLDRVGAKPDLEWAGPLGTEVAWTHRRTDDADLYYLSNLMPQTATLQLRLRADAQHAEVWRPDTGGATPCPASTTDGRTELQLRLQPNETVFVVLHDDTPTAEAARSIAATEEIEELTGPWTVSFPPNLGAPEEITIDTLAPLTDHQTPGVKYFSGTARFLVRFEAAPEWLDSGGELLLDLGDVRDIAQASLNGRPLGLCWKSPYRFDLRSALRSGENELEVSVTNQWTNRIAGDLAGPPDQQVLPGSRGGLRFRPPRLAESGLLGPVRILAAPAATPPPSPQGTSHD